MPQYLVLHTLDLGRLPKGGQLWAAAYDLLDLYTKDCYCSQSWIGLQGFYAGKMACLWEAPSKEAIVDMLSKVTIGPPVDAIFDSTLVVDWAEEKRKRVQKKATAPPKKAKATAKKPTRKR